MHWSRASTRVKARGASPCFASPYATLGSPRKFTLALLMRMRIAATTTRVAADSPNTLAIASAAIRSDSEFAISAGVSAERKATFINR